MISFERNRFVEQRENAVQRGIPFLLTFEQWWKIWESSGHWHERGCKAHQYVMARLGDKGPYAVSNVKIITWTQNIKERKITEKQRKTASELGRNLVFTNDMRRKISESKRGSNNYHAKLTEAMVKKIRNEYIPRRGDMGKLAIKFGVSRTSIFGIVKRKTWRHI